jgi:hypothetical protein
MPGIRKTIKEFEAGKLHSGSKHGPIVKSLAQARAIGLSEERKAGHQVAPKHHSFESSNQPFGQTKAGEAAAHAIPQGHKVSGSERKNDGAGRHGHNMEMHHASEHKTPMHPAGSHTVQGYIPASEGVAGHPGDVMKLAHDGGKLVGGDYSQSAHEPAVLKTPDGQGFTAGHPGVHAGMSAKPSGYGHQAHQKSGVHRLSGHSGAHRIGKR